MVSKKENNKGIKKTLKTVWNILFYVFMVLMVFLIVLSVVSKKTEKPILKYSILWVLTDSMEPTIGEQSYILVKNADVSSLKVGDIITFISKDEAIKGSFNTHRIKEIVVEGEEFITQGDNVGIEDVLHVFADEIVYKYVCNLNVLTFFGRIYSTLYGFILTVCLILVVLIIYLFGSIKKINKEQSEKDKQAEFDRLVAEEVARLERENNRE